MAELLNSWLHGFRAAHARCKRFRDVDNCAHCCGFGKCDAFRQHGVLRAVIARGSYGRRDLSCVHGDTLGSLRNAQNPISGHSFSGHSWNKNKNGYLSGCRLCTSTRVWCDPPSSARNGPLWRCDQPSSARNGGKKQFPARGRSASLTLLNIGRRWLTPATHPDLPRAKTTQ